MSKLPDETVLSGPSIGPSSRPIASYDTTGYAKGAAALGAGAKALGEGLEKAGKDVSVVNKQQQEDDDKLELARAKSDFLTQKVTLDSGLGDETDHETLPGRYSASLGEIQQKAAANIRNPQLREKFVLSTTDDVARGNVLADRTANKLWSDATLADANTRLEATRQAALSSTDPVERQRLIDNGRDIIHSLEAKGIYSKDGARQTEQDWVTKYAAGAISMLPAPDRLKVLGGFEGALVNRESGGKAGLVNQLGYAGLYQFGAPRLAAMGVYKPGGYENLETWSKTPANDPSKWSGTFDIPGHPEVRTLQDFLGSPDAQKAAFNIHSGKMDEEIKSNGFDKYIGQNVGGVTITREGLHAMLHLGGVGGTRNALEGKGNASDANGTSVLDYAKLGNQSDLTRLTSILPVDTRARMQNEAQREVDSSTVKAAAAQSEVWERKIIDASAGVGTLPNRIDIQNDPALDPPRRNALLRQFDSAAGDVAGLQNFMAKFKDPQAGSFNPYDTEERKYADKAFSALGGDPAALQAIVARTGILPKSAAVAMHGSLVSNDPKRVADALTLASNLINANPNAFVGVDGKSEFENNAVEFRHYVDDRGMTAQEAAQKIIRGQSPEYQASVKAKLKTEDVDAKIKKELNIDDLAGQFDQVPWIPFTDPKVGFSPKMRADMYGQYAEGVKDHYLENGDWNLSKKLAANDLKKTWGVSKVNGSQTVMQYPPERAPAYAGLADPSAAISKQAIEAVKGESSLDVARKDIMLAPIPGATALAYTSGRPVPYMLMWNDKDGVQHMLNPGRAFVADPAAMKAAQSEQRQTDLAKEQAAAAPLLDTLTQHKAQQRASRKALSGRDPSDTQYNILGDFVGRLFGSSDPQMVTAEKIKNYPVSEDVQFAKQAGFYNDIYEPWTNGEVARVIKGSGSGQTVSDLTSEEASKIVKSNPVLAEVYAKGALVSNRIPVAALGFNPDRTALETTVTKPNVAGAYDADSDRMFVVAASASTIVHESIHRGLEYLRKNNPEARQIMARLRGAGSVSEESIVRYLMATQAGDPEKGAGDVADQQRDLAMSQFDGGNAPSQRRKDIDRLNAIAQELVAKRYPSRGARQ